MLNKIFTLKNINRYNVLIVLLALLPIIFLLVNVSNKGVNVPHLDQWEMVPLLEKMDTGTLGFSDLWEQHNEHRIFFPLAVALGLAKATSWYIPAEVMASFAFSIIGFIFLFDLLKKSVNKNFLLLSVFTFLISAWYFSPIQWENWLWGWQVEWFMCITAVIVSIYGLYRLSLKKQKGWFALSVLGATIATFSLGSGILIWILGAAMILVTLRPLDKRYFYAWCLVGVTEALLYYKDYIKPQNHPSLTAAFDHPRQFLEYFLTTLGRPFTDNPHTALILGSLVLVSLVPITYYSYGIISKKLKILSAWFAILLYGLLGLAITSASRLEFGIPSAMSSRYTAFSLLFLVGILGVVCVNFAENKNKKSMQKGLFTFTILLTPLLLSSYVVGVREMGNWSVLFNTLRTCTHEPNPSRECLITTYPPSESVVRERLNYLKQNDLAGY